MAIPLPYMTKESLPAPATSLFILCAVPMRKEVPGFSTKLSVFTVSCDKHKPYEKHHSTVKDACELAQSLQVPNLVLWHTEEDHGSDRPSLYLAEGRDYYTGNLFVPEDKTILDL